MTAFDCYAPAFFWYAGGQNPWFTTSSPEAAAIMEVHSNVVESDLGSHVADHSLEIVG